MLNALSETVIESCTISKSRVIMEIIGYIVDSICFYHYKFQNPDHYSDILLMEHLNIYRIQKFLLQMMMISTLKLSPLLMMELIRKFFDIKLLSLFEWARSLL